MSNNLEEALRRALGVELVDANGDTEAPLPSTPIALNDDDGLRGIILRELRDHDTNQARQKQSTDALHTMIQHLEK